MASFQKWRFPWSLATVAVLILSLVSLIHLFLYPIVPSLDYFRLRQADNPCVSVNDSIEARGKYDLGKVLKNETKVIAQEDSQPVVDLNSRYPADLHNAVTYLDAPWKAEIGRWLSGCDATVKEVVIIEVILT